MASIRPLDHTQWPGKDGKGWWLKLAASFGAFFLVTVLFYSPGRTWATSSASCETTMLLASSPADGAWCSSTACRTARATQQQFCATLFTNFDVPPPQVEVSWSDTVQRSSDPAASTMRTLARVDGISNLATGGGSEYTLYALTDNDIVSQQIIETKGWEVPDIQMMIQHLEGLASDRGVPKDQVYFVDIGANIGTYTMAVAAAGFSVLAFEPMRVNQHAMRLSLCANPELMKRVTFFNNGLGRAPARCEIWSGHINLLDGLTLCDSSHQPDPEHYSKRQDIDVMRMDDLLADWLPALEGKVGALKIDTEVFEGATNFMTRAKPLFLVTEVGLSSITNYTAMQYVQLLKGFGYHMHKGDFDQPELSDQGLDELVAEQPIFNLFLTA